MEQEARTKGDLNVSLNQWRVGKQVLDWNLAEWLPLSGWGATGWEHRRKDSRKETDTLVGLGEEAR